MYIDVKESLQSENIPDPMEGEQTWPTEEELAEAEESRVQKRKVKKVPKGMSDYQAAWIPDNDAGEGCSVHRGLSVKVTYEINVNIHCNRYF